MYTPYKLKGIMSEIFIERRIWVYLPPSYNNSHEAFPVIYLQDGIRLIDPQVCHNIHIFETWFEQETVAEFIIIAIETLNRNDEYTPWKSVKDAHLYGAFGGQGDSYLDYLIGTVKFSIDQQYRTLPDSTHTSLVGCSLGGLIAIYGGLRYPTIFGKIAGLSSSVWFEGFSDYAIRTASSAANSKIYLDVSKAEGKNMLSSNQEFYDLLKVHGFPTDHLHFHIAEKGKHTTEHFIKRLPNALEWLIGRSQSQ